MAAPRCKGSSRSPMAASPTPRRLLGPLRGAGGARLGGSHAQRDVIDQTLLAAAARGGDAAAGRALLAGRARGRAHTPLTDWWAEALERRARGHDDPGRRRAGCAAGAGCCSAPYCRRSRSARAVRRALASRTPSVPIADIHSHYGMIARAMRSSGLAEDMRPRELRPSAEGRARRRPLNHTRGGFKPSVANARSTAGRSCIRSRKGFRCGRLRAGRPNPRVQRQRTKA